MGVSKAGFRGVQGKTRAEQVPSKGVPGPSPKKQQRQQFSNQRPDKTKVFPQQSRSVGLVDIMSDAVSTCAESEWISESEESGVEEKNADQTQGSRESQVRSKPPGQFFRTTAVIRNIPPEFTRARLLELIDNQGFDGLYDFVYLPIDFQTELNHCYAFINLITAEDAERFRAH